MEINGPCCYKIMKKDMMVPMVCELLSKIFIGGSYLDYQNLNLMKERRKAIIKLWSRRYNKLIPERVMNKGLMNY